MLRIDGVEKGACDVGELTERSGELIRYVSLGMSEGSPAVTNDVLVQRVALSS